MPDWIGQEPVPFLGDEFFIKAFFDLSTCRSTGMGLGPIPWKDIVLHAQVSGLDEEITPAFIAIMQKLDKAYLDWVDKNKKVSTPDGE